MPTELYLTEERLIIRSMKHTDPQILHEEFNGQGWEKPLEVLTGYYERQEAGLLRMIVAEWDGMPAGYVALMPCTEHGPFAHSSIPYLSDLIVFKKYQRRGIANKIMDIAERLAFEQHMAVCLGVGLHSGYGAAQRMYVKRGYIPDGSGVWYRDEPLAEYAPCTNDDDLVLYLSKARP